MGAQMLGNPSDKKPAFPPLLNSIFSSFTLQKGSISWSQSVNNQSLVPTCTRQWARCWETGVHKVNGDYVLVGKRLLLSKQTR